MADDGYHVVFDLGGVVLTQTRRLPAIARRLGIDESDPQAFARFEDAYRRPRLEYDRTSDASAYWTAVARACDVAAPDERACTDLTALDNEGWSHTDPDTVALIDDLHRADVPLAILSNMPSSMGRLVRTSPWARPFEHVVISGDLGVVKPDPRIYHTLLETIGLPPERVIFVDDLARNTEAAQTLGIHAVRFTGADSFRAHLRTVGIGV